MARDGLGLRVAVARRQFPHGARRHPKRVVYHTLCMSQGSQKILVTWIAMRLRQTMLRQQWGVTVLLVVTTRSRWRCWYGVQLRSSRRQINLLEIKNYHHNHRLHCIHKGSWTMNKANQLLSFTYNDMKRGFGLSDRCINHPRVFRSLYFRRQHKMCTIVN